MKLDIKKFYLSRYRHNFFMKETEYSESGIGNHYEFIRSFYNDICKISIPNRYNLVCHKHLGDVFYAVALNKEFEKKYHEKLHYIIRPQHQFIMKMYGITDYTIFDLDILVKKNEALRNDYFKLDTVDPKENDRLENNLFIAIFFSIPIKGHPFICENIVNDWLNYSDYFAYRWAFNLAINTDFKFPLPIHQPKLSDNIKAKLVKIAPLDKIVLIAPEAITALEFSPKFWNIIADYLHKHEYKIIVNSNTAFKISSGISSFELGLSLEDIVALGYECAYVFALRSGLCDILIGIGKKLYSFYPALLHREFYSLNKCFEPKSKVNEIAIWRFKTDPVKWENEDLTLKLQQYINQMRYLYISEKIKSVLFIFNNTLFKKHKEMYKMIRNTVGKSKILQENNKCNKHLKDAYSWKISLLGFPLLSRKYEIRKTDLIIKWNILGGLFYLKRNRGTLDFRILGIRLFSINNYGYKVLFLKKSNDANICKWFANIQKQIDHKHDDIYLIRHNIGESHIELMHFMDTVKAYGSKNPLLIVWNKKHLSFYKMYGLEGLMVQYIDIKQSDIHLIFSEKKKFKQKTRIIEHNGQRFICQSPNIFRSMVYHKTNFYNYLCDAGKVAANSKAVLPKASPATIKSIEDKIKKIGLSEKFVIFAPEATSLKEINPEFWNQLAAALQEKGFDIFWNILEPNYIYPKNIKYVKTSIEELFALAQKTSGIVSLGSGLAVFLTATGSKMDLIYSGFNGRSASSADQVLKLYSVHHIPYVSKDLVREYSINKISEDELLKKIIKRY